MSDLPTPRATVTDFEPGAQEIARTYAQALLNLLPDDGDAERVVGEFSDLLNDVWDAHPDFATLLSSNFLSVDRRDEVLGEAFAGRADDVLVRFLRVVSQRSRLGLLPTIYTEARKALDKRTKQVEVVVTSAVPLGEKELAAVRSRVKGLVGDRTPTIRPKVDPDILGGLVVQIGDRRYDASVRSALKGFHDQLMDIRYREIRQRREELFHTH